MMKDLKVISQDLHCERITIHHIMYITVVIFYYQVCTLFNAIFPFIIVIGSKHLQFVLMFSPLDAVVHSHDERLIICFCQSPSFACATLSCFILHQQLGNTNYIWSRTVDD